MINARAVRASLLLASFGLLAAGPALTQTQPERVPLIMTKLPPQNSALYKRIIKHAGKARGQVLTLTKTEMWEVPKENVDAVKKAAAEHGASATQLGTDWNHVFHKAPADMTMNDKQKTMMENAKSSKSTMGVGMMASPMAPMVEYALTKDAGPNIGGPATSKDAARITIKLSDKTELTIVRTNVDIKPDMCVWRGAVEGTDAPATIMWWPGGKMAGTLQHEGKIYSIRHMGGEMHAVVEMGEDRMPQEHAPMPERMRANDPNLRDDPLLNEGDASIMKPKRQQKGGQLKGKRQQQAKLQQAKTTADQKVAAVSVADPTTKKAAAKASPAPKDIVIDVIVAYTKKAAGNYTDVKRELVDLSIEEANESFRRSGVGQVKLKLVHAYQTDYVEEGRALRSRLALRRQGRRLHGRDPWPARQVPRRRRHPHRRRSERLRAGNARLRRRRGGLCRGAPRVRGRELQLGARRPPPPPPPPPPKNKNPFFPPPRRPRRKQGGKSRGTKKAAGGGPAPPGGGARGAGGGERGGGRRGAPRNGGVMGGPAGAPPPLPGATRRLGRASAMIQPTRRAFSPGRGRGSRDRRRGS